MDKLPHAPDCELGDTDKPHLHITLQLRHREGTHASTGIVVIDTYEQCPSCLEGVRYFSNHLPIWKFERSWTRNLRTWWITYCHRSKLWDELPLEGPEPPF